MVAVANSYHLFNENKWKDGGKKFVNPQMGVYNLLGWLKETLGMFKIITNFTLPNFKNCVVKSIHLL